MPEIHESFSTISDWRAFTKRLGNRTGLIDAIVADVQTSGYVEPFTEIHRQPYEIKILPKNIRESISAHELNSRKRALLLQTYIEMERHGWLGNNRLKVLGAEAITRVARILRGQFPLYLGAEYLPDEAAQADYFPVPHLDLQDISYPDASFDVFVSGDVFEHVPDLDKALAEIARILKPGGMLISSFPFNPSREETLVKARLLDDGTVEHLTEPEYHGNPIDPEAGSLVFSIPGWDILDKLKSLGFEEAAFNFLASSRYGVAVQNSVGALTLVARKGGSETEAAPKNTYFLSEPAPRKVVGALGLPRSGTTLLTSLFAVHSQFEAVYEPWNAKQFDEDVAKLPDILGLLKPGKLEDKALFVKETAAKPSYIRNMRELLSTTPPTLSKHLLIILRRPDQTYLSEIVRRKQWWNSDVELSQESFDNWCTKSQPAIAQFLGMLNSTPSTALTLEALSAEPEALLNILCHRLGEAFEPQQLHYEATLDRKQVRGDKNVGEKPAAISPKLATSRENDYKKVKKLAKASAHSDWFSAFEDFHAFVQENDGWIDGATIPVRIRRQLLS